MARRQMYLAISAVLCTTVLTACTTFRPDDVAKPKDITVAKALEDIGAGFSAMKRELDSQIIGVYPCAIKVSLNVSASATDEGKLVIDFATKPRVLEGVTTPGNPAATLRGEASAKSSAGRGNTINIEMYNPGCLPKDTLGFQNPDKVGNAAEGMALLGNTMLDIKEDPKAD